MEHGMEHDAAIILQSIYRGYSTRLQTVIRLIENNRDDYKIN